MCGGTVTLGGHNTTTLEKKTNVDNSSINLQYRIYEKETLLKMLHFSEGKKKKERKEKKKVPQTTRGSATKWLVFLAEPARFGSKDFL